MDAQQASTRISEPRFRPFLDTTGGNHQAAVALYAWHAEVAAACFEVIHHFEVVVRNSIDATLGEGQPEAPLKDTGLDRPRRARLDCGSLQGAHAARAHTLRGAADAPGRDARGRPKSLG
ncbi:MAG: hypothetical protein ACHQE6_10500 [Solirubrobacterales bacterium]